MFTPGQTAMAPVNVSSKKELRFFARGEEGRSYAVMMFTRSKGQMPVMQRFTTSAEWKEVVLPIASFQGIDGRCKAFGRAARGARAGWVAFILSFSTRRTAPNSVMPIYRRLQRLRYIVRRWFHGFTDLARRTAELL